MRSVLALLALLSLALAAPDTASAARKRGPGKPTPDRTAENCAGQEGDGLAACQVVGKFLDLCKAQKWNEAKKLIHPKTLEVIERTRKTTGEERHGMAPWYWAKTAYMVTDWKLDQMESSLLGTWQLHSIETRYQVEEDGHSEGEASTYIAGKLNGTWYVVDVQRGGGSFRESAIKVGMRGYFDPVEEKAPEAEQAAEKPAVPNLAIEPKPDLKPNLPAEEGKTADVE